MNSKIHRCGWCGSITDASGDALDGEAFEKAARIIDTYGDGHSHMVQGYCCAERDEPRYETITRDMARDAGDPGLEGTSWRW